MSPPHINGGAVAKHALKSEIFSAPCGVGAE
jgi:hypothetical protein